MASSKKTRDKNIGNWEKGGKKINKSPASWEHVFCVDKCANGLPISFHHMRPRSSALLMINGTDVSFWTEIVPDNTHQ